MSERTFYERVVERRGFRYIRLKSGRLITYLDARQAAERAETDLARAVSRCFKLVDGDDDLEHLGYYVEHLQTYVHALAAEMERLGRLRAARARIAALRQVQGRTSAEARAFRRKADDLERQLKAT